MKYFTQQAKIPDNEINSLPNEVIHKMATK